MCTKARCNVICDIYAGCSTTIDASHSQDLTVKCTHSYACSETKLLHGPSLSLDITCDGDRACVSSSWSANYTGMVRIQCITDSWSYDPACADATFEASSASLVNVNCQGEKSCSSMTLYANSAKVVSVTANGENSLFQSTIQALHAGHFNLFCKPSWLYSNTRDYTCWNNYLYVPSAFNLTCYGQSCYQLGDLYVADSSITQGAQVYYNGCGDSACANAGDCAPHVSIHCSANTWRNSDQMYGDYCISDNCGCQQLVSTFQTQFFVDQGVCPAVPDLSGVVKLVTGVILAIIFGSLCCCICVCVAVYYMCCKPRHVARNAALLGATGYVAANQQPAVQPQVVVMNPMAAPQTQAVQGQVVYVPPQQQAVVQGQPVMNQQYVVQQPVVQQQVVTAPAVTDGGVNAYPRL
eukprot:126059_1